MRHSFALDDAMRSVRNAYRGLTAARKTNDIAAIARASAKYDAARKRQGEIHFRLSQE